MNGFALPVVMFALSLGSALAVGGAFVTRQMAAGAKLFGRSAEVDGSAAEWAVRTAAGAGASVEATTIGIPSALGQIDTPGSSVERWIVRADSAIAWVIVEATSKDKPLQRRRLGVLLVRTDTSWSPSRSRALVELP